jgi:translation elongation factor P/translation initiation factor 5A
MVEVGSLKKGDYVLYKDAPFLVSRIKPVVVSRHSHAKTKLEITSMLTGEKKTLTLPDSEKMEKVEIIRKHGQYIARIGEGYGQVMDLKDYSVCDAKIPEDLELKEGDEVVFIEFKGRAHVIGLWERGP